MVLVGGVSVDTPATYKGSPLSGLGRSEEHTSELQSH